jgi:hypothetical protein
MRKICPCGAVFSGSHGNRKYCSKRCPRRKKRQVSVPATRMAWPPRECDLCGQVFVPRAPNQRFCTISHQLIARKPEERLLYHNTAHRSLRKRWDPVVAEGGVVCAGPNGCGQLIRPGERWDLGHLPGGVRHPQHSRCNRATGGVRSDVGRIW